ncbi:hypothetical protein [Cerasicoccus arenae]|uniref:hypothetical protein n=1 Tax=Cerasicoccus arenae TaxID=424488 RepID=UPI0035F0969C
MLDDPLRKNQIDVVVLRYWQRQPDGTMWAPRGDGQVQLMNQQLPSHHGTEITKPTAEDWLLLLKR